VPHAIMRPSTGLAPRFFHSPPRLTPLGPAGPEHTPLALSRSPISREQGAQNDTPRARDLDELIDRWPSLPERVRQAILALVRAEAGDRDNEIES